MPIPPAGFVEVKQPPSGFVPFSPPAGFIPVEPEHPAPSDTETELQQKQPATPSTFKDVVVPGVLGTAREALAKSAAGLTAPLLMPFRGLAKTAEGLKAGETPGQQVEETFPSLKEESETPSVVKNVLINAAKATPGVVADFVAGAPAQMPIFGAAGKAVEAVAPKISPILARLAGAGTGGAVLGATGAEKLSDVPKATLEGAGTGLLYGGAFEVPGVTRWFVKGEPIQPNPPPTYIPPVDVPLNPISPEEYIRARTLEPEPPVPMTAPPRVGALLREPIRLHAAFDELAKERAEQEAFKAGVPIEARTQNLGDVEEPISLGPTPESTRAKLIKNLKNVPEERFGNRPFESLRGISIPETSREPIPATSSSGLFIGGKRVIRGEPQPQFSVSKGEIVPPEQIETKPPESPQTAEIAQKSPVKQFIKQDVIPGMTEAAKTFTDATDDVKKAFAPVSRGEEARVESGIIRANAAELARKKEMAYAATDKLSSAFDKMPVEHNLVFIDNMERGKAQSTPELQKAADTLESIYSSRRDALRKLNPDKQWHFIDDYLAHIWKDPEQARNVFARIFGKHPLQGPASFLKQRTIPTISEGVAAGLEPVSTNPVELTLLKAHEIDRYIMGQQIFGEMKDKGLAQFVRFGERAPDGLVKINDKIAQVYQYSESDKGMIARGEYWGPEPAVRILNNYLSPGLQNSGIFRGWRAAGNLLMSARLGFSGFHLMFTSLDAASSKLSLGVGKIARGDIVEGLREFPRTTILSAPFETYFKGLKMEKEYYAPGSQGELVRKITDSFIQAGGRAKMDSFYKNSAMESFWKAWNSGNVPGAVLRSIPATLEAVAKPIMEYIVPRMKMGVYFDMAKYELQKNPNMSQDQMRTVLGRIWDSVDNRMGQMTYDNLFLNKAVKDMGLASVQSLGWNIGDIRELGGGSVDVIKQLGRAGMGKRFEMTPKMQYLVSMPVVVGLHGAILTYLLTGKGPQELKDYYFIKTGRKNPDGTDERLALASYMRDIYPLVSTASRNPAGVPSKLLEMMKHKAAPQLSMLFDMLTNKDFYNTEIRHSGDPLVQQAMREAEYMAKQFVPFSVRNYLREKEMGNTSLRAMGSFFGMPPASASAIQTPAEKLAFEYSAQNMPRPARTQAQFDRNRLVSKYANELRDESKRKEVVANIKSDLQAGKLVQSDIANILNRQSESGLMRAYKHLSAAQALDVWDEANEDEREKLYPVLVRKVINHLPNAAPDDAKSMSDALNKIVKSRKAIK